MKMLTDYAGELEREAVTLRRQADLAVQAAAKLRQSAEARSHATSNGGSKQTRGRPKGSGVRHGQALELAQNHPGITIPEMAQAMGIAPNYLYRVLPAMAERGLVRRDENAGWHPAS